MGEGRTWFCQECQTMMEHHREGFDKCPVCGAEAWPSGEASYRRYRPKEAAFAEKIHGTWYCQRCRVPMIPVDGDYCKCPVCTAEVWYGVKRKTDEWNAKELMETTEDTTMLSYPGDVYQGAGRRPVKGGGSHNGKRRNKANMQKPTTEELYRQLCSD